MAPRDSLKKKLVIVGDGYCGKTTLLLAFKDGKFNDVYVPTVFEDQTANLVVDGYNIVLNLWDTAGQEDYERLRPLAYPESDVVLICFTVEQRASLENVQHVWLKEVLHYVHGVPIFLVACKKDLRLDPATQAKMAKQGTTFVSPEEGQGVARAINAYRYVECSAKTGENVIELFEEIGRSLIPQKKAGKNKKAKKSKKCVIL
ncbi:hypothetical protein DASC09_045830 [Saccharomycopsis crataegensis]|uniref:Uncharacterized protein n=1 Tax=Saccharomycopsis crataegensis TaxID=43959 RepID=A0AAV5QSY5_9ASCO|nr:hypothetical protein DASC09_045830 [Saccharomycopsis crataegensis]